jgi:hypothetical protein
VLGSLWLVREDVNLVVMEEVHRSLLEGKSLGQATREGINRLRGMTTQETSEKLASVLVSSENVEEVRPRLTVQAEDVLPPGHPALWSGLFIIGNPAMKTV